MTIKYNFFGKNLDPNANLAKQLEAKNFKFNQIVFLQQIHSNQVTVIDERNQQLPQNTQGDGLVTNLKNIVIGVTTADCCPVLFFCKKSQIIAAAHAGWKGAKSGIIKSVVNEINNSATKLGFKNIEIQAKIGPSIRQESYEVGPEFLDDFLAEDQNNRRFFIDSKKNHHYMFDLVGYVKQKLKNEGINNIEDCNIDTYQNSSDYFSYRRSCHLNKIREGNNLSVIMAE